MSSVIDPSIADSEKRRLQDGALDGKQPSQIAIHKNYKGFVAGVFSGIAKLSGRCPISVLFVTISNR